MGGGVGAVASCALESGAIEKIRIVATAVAKKGLSDPCTIRNFPINEVAESVAEAGGKSKRRVG